MRISDWSSDVCSSDLAQPYLAEGDRFIIEDLGIHILDVARLVMGEAATLTCRTQRVNPAVRGEDVATILLGHTSGATSVVDCSYATPVHDELFPQKIGRASCRERVCQYV